MRRAELAEQVRRLADQTAYLAAEVRRGDTALELLGQVRDFGHRLPPGLAVEIRWVVDDMVATRHEAQAGPHSPAAGTSSAGDGAGSASPAAPSTETRQAAQDGQSGSDGGAMDGVPAHQPTPKVGDVWQCGIGRLRVRSVSSDTDGLTWTATNGVKYRGIPWGDWRLVERDGKPWPPAQESDPVGVEPATDRQIAQIERAVLSGISPGERSDALALVARVRKEQATLRAARRERDHEQRERKWAQRNYAQAEGREKAATHDRDKALQRTAEAERERDEAVARAEKAEATLARVERVTAAERAVVRAAVEHAEASDIAPTWGDLCDAVRALRDAEEEDDRG